MSASSPLDEGDEHYIDCAVSTEGEYLLYLPDDYDTEPAWPLILSLHGAGEWSARKTQTSKLDVIA